MYAGREEFAMSDRNRSLNAAEVIEISGGAQGEGAFVDVLNRIRADELIRKIREIDLRESHATELLEELRDSVLDLIESNRGGSTGIHGFIGERVQVYFSDARAIMAGEDPLYFLLDDNSMTDYLRDTIKIQQKACRSGCFGLDHIAAHADKYPLFTYEGGIYQIPRDFHKKYLHYVEMPKEEAGKLLKEEYRNWKHIQQFQKAMPDVKIEPMLVDYADIQVAKVEDTIDQEVIRTKNNADSLRTAAEECSKATIKEALKTAAISAAFEGVIDGGLSLSRHLDDDTKIRDLNAEAWKEIGCDTAKGAARGAIRGTTVYVASNMLNISAPAAAAATSGLIAVAEEVSKCSSGEKTREECVTAIAEDVGLILLSAIGAEIGKRFIRVPVLGSVLGSILGSAVFKFSKILVFTR